jgi:hypothetical protein
MNSAAAQTSPAQIRAIPLQANTNGDITVLWRVINNAFIGLAGSCCGRQ